MDLHVFPIPIPTPTSLSTRSLWVFPVHQARALVSCIQLGLVVCFTLDNIHVSMLFSWNIPPSPSLPKSNPLGFSKTETDLKENTQTPPPSSPWSEGKKYTTPGPVDFLTEGVWVKAKQYLWQSQPKHTGSLKYQDLIKGFGEGNSNPLQYSCLENPVDRGAWWAAVCGVTQSWTQLKQLSMHAGIGEGNGNPLQYSCLENPRDRGAWWAAIYGVTQSQTWLKWLSSSNQGIIKYFPFSHTLPPHNRLLYKRRLQLKEKQVSSSI